MTIAFDLGEKIKLDLDDWIPYQIFLTGLYAMERSQTEFFRSVVRKGMIVLDVGANIGYYTLQAAARVGEEGQVHAFEPVGETYARLVENIRLNGFCNVVANRAVLHDHRGSVDVFVADDSNTGGSRLSPVMHNYTGRREKVECLTVDDYLKSRGLEQVDLVKIDVEGSEPYVLRGMRRLLEMSENLLLLVEISGESLRTLDWTPADVFRYLRTLHFYPSRITMHGLVDIDPSDARAEHDEALVLFRKKKVC